jgi:peptidyl-prolyl cis-trans isomerase D
MFDSIRKHQRLLQLILLLLILPAFAFFGISGYDRMFSGERGIASVGGTPITQQEFDQAQRQQVENLRQMLGDGVDTRMFDTPEARGQILEGLIAQRAIAAEAARLKVAVTDEKVRETILSIPGLRKDDGSFDDARYKALLSSQNLSAAGFEARLRSDLALQALPEAVQFSAMVPGTVRDRVVALQEEGREVRELRLAAADFAPKVNPTPEQIRRYYDDNPQAFETPESAKIEYVVLSRDALASQVALGPEDLKTYYEQNQARYTTPQERRASHILVKAGPEAKAKAEQILARLKANPAEFEAIAKAQSDDPGSAAQGGDLGYFSRSAMVKPFADAAFEMSEGAIQGPVQSEFGLHIIKLTGVRAGGQKRFEEVRAELEAEVRAQQAAQRFAEAAEQFTNTVYEQSDSLKPVADKFKLEIRTADAVTRLPDPGAPRNSPLASPRLLSAVFSDDVLKNRRNTEAVEIAPSTLAAARVLEYRAPQRRPLEQVESEVRARVIAQESARLAREAGEARIAALRQGAKADGPGAFGAPRLVSRAAPAGLSQTALDAIFRMPADKLPAYAGVDLGEQGFAVFELTRRVEPSPEALAQRRATYDQQIGRVVAQQDVVDYVEALKSRTKVARHPERLGARGESR